MGSCLLNAMRMNDNKGNKRPLKGGFFVAFKIVLLIKSMRNKHMC